MKVDDVFAAARTITCFAKKIVSTPFGKECVVTPGADCYSGEQAACFCPSCRPWFERNERMIIILIRFKCYCCCGGELLVMSIDELLNLQGSSSSLGARDNPPSKAKTVVDWLSHISR